MHLFLDVAQVFVDPIASAFVRTVRIKATTEQASKLLIGAHSPISSWLRICRLCDSASSADCTSPPLYDWIIRSSSRNVRTWPVDGSMNRSTSPVLHGGRLFLTTAAVSVFSWRARS